MRFGTLLEINQKCIFLGRDPNKKYVFEMSLGYFLTLMLYFSPLFGRDHNTSY